MADEPEDEQKRKFREALERKKANSAGGTNHTDGGQQEGRASTGPWRTAANSDARAANASRLHAGAWPPEPISPQAHRGQHGDGDREAFPRGAQSQVLSGEAEADHR